MGKRIGLVAAAMMMAVFASPIASAKEKSLDDKSAAVNGKALAAIRSGDPARALAMIEPVLADYDKAYEGEKRRIYCSGSPEQTLMYLLLSTTSPDKKDAVAIGPGWCNAQYIRAFALVDLKRLDDAQVAFERLIGFAPQNARYLNELGYVLQARRQWQASIDVYTRAVDATDVVPDGRDYERCVALRGIGYDLVELGKLDEAEAAYRKCLAITPGEPKSLDEIKYIREQRKKAV